MKAEDILSLIEGELGGVQEHFVVGAIDQLHKVVDHPSVPTVNDELEEIMIMLINMLVTFR